MFFLEKILKYTKIMIFVQLSFFIAAHCRYRPTFFLTFFRLQRKVGDFQALLSVDELMWFLQFRRRTAARTGAVPCPITFGVIAASQYESTNYVLRHRRHDIHGPHLHHVTTQ